MTAPTHQPADYAFLALTLWREARGGGAPAMTAVAWVVRNRVLKRSSSYFAEVTRPLQFSSMSAKGDPQLIAFPYATEPFWGIAQRVAAEVIEAAQSAADPTHGSTIYYDDSIPFPETWDKTKVQATIKLGRLNFFQEKA